MEFTMVDGGVLAVTLLSGVLAYTRGLTREVFAIAGWVLAALAAFALAPVLEPLMREAPLVGDFLATSCVLSMIAAFTVVVAAALLIMSVFTPLFASAVQGSVLGPLDRALGFAFGVARGVLLIAIAYLLYDNLKSEPWPPVENAASHAVLAEAANTIRDNLPESVPDWFGGQIDALMAPCGGAPAAPAAPTAATPS